MAFWCNQESALDALVRYCQNDVALVYHVYKQLFKRKRASSPASAGAVKRCMPLRRMNARVGKTFNRSDEHDDFACLPDDDTSVVGENEIVPVATIVGPIRLPNKKTKIVTEVLYDETQIFLGQSGCSNFRVDDRQVVLLVEAGKVWLYPGQHQKVGVSNGPKQPTIVVKSRCQLFDKYEFTLGVTESPFKGDTKSPEAQKSHVAKARERDRVFIGNQREQLQREPAQYPSCHIRSRQRGQSQEGLARFVCRCQAAAGGPQRGGMPGSSVRRGCHQKQH